ncbi:8980_t:CDS:1, partial [Entrophospora sp. SA101]
IEHLQRHMKRNYENEIKLKMMDNLTMIPVYHIVLHMLFGICTDSHEIICSDCDEFWVLFKDLYLVELKKYIEGCSR